MRIKMPNAQKIILLLAVLVTGPLAQAEDIKTFKIENIGGVITVTQDIPAYFLGVYESTTPDVLPGKMLLKKGRDAGSYHEWEKKSGGKLFTWGVLVKDGKIEKQRITPPNAAYKPYDKMKLIVRYEDETMALVTWGLYRAESEKFGTRIVAARYVKTMPGRTTSK